MLLQSIGHRRGAVEDDGRAEKKPTSKERTPHDRVITDYRSYHVIRYNTFCILLYYLNSDSIFFSFCLARFEKRLRGGISRCYFIHISRVPINHSVVVESLSCIHK